MIFLSEMRQNKLTGEWVIYAVNRKKRPYDFKNNMEPKELHPKNCPFCKGNEDKTTNSVYEDKGNGEWSIRVFPNMYPAVDENANITEIEPFYSDVPGKGRHEVLVDTPNHYQTIDTFTTPHLEKILTVLQERYSDIRKEEYVKYVQIFKNCGPEAGMSLSHSHWQIIGLPTEARRITIHEKIEKRYTINEGGCLFCDMINYETERRCRVVCESENFLSFTPYASRFPYELWIAPRRHISTFSELTSSDLKELATVLKDVFGKVNKIREGISYNICFMDAPKNKGENIHHWHIQILPRVGGFAGLEYSSETYINSVLPEEAAKFYREEE